MTLYAFRNIGSQIAYVAKRLQVDMVNESLKPLFDMLRRNNEGINPIEFHDREIWDREDCVHFQFPYAALLMTTEM